MQTHYTARCLIARQGAILVMRGKGESFTHLPGGHIDPGEAPIDALIREMREEVGAELASIEWLAKIEDNWPGGQVHETMDLYAARTYPLTMPLRALEPHLDAFWVQYYRVEAVNLRPRAVWRWAAHVGVAER